MLECAASLSYGLGGSAAYSSNGDLRAYGWMTRKTESESPSPTRNAGASNLADGAALETPDGSTILGS